MFDNNIMLEEEYNCFDKNIKMLADIASVEYGIKLGDSEFSISNSFRRVLEGIKDSDVYIDYSGNYLDNYSDIKSDIEDYINNNPKYKKYFKKLLDNDLEKDIRNVQEEYVSYFNADPIRMEKTTIDVERNRGYNLINLFVKYKRFDFLNDLLLLDVGKHTKRNIVGAILNSFSYNDQNFSILSSFINQDKYRDIVEDYAKSLISVEKKEMLENSSKKLTLMLQKKGLVDFNDKDVLFESKDNKKVAPIIKFLDDSNVISNMSFFYDDSYLNYPEEVRKNTDNLVIDIVLNKFHSITHTKQVLNFKNFNVDEEVVDTLCKYFLKNEVNSKIVNEVADIIISKSKNSNEYRKNKKYANMLLINTDKEKLKELRGKLLQIFYVTTYDNLNMKVGDIKVYKKN